jgi:hypothetical protein
VRVYGKEQSSVETATVTDFGVIIKKGTITQCEKKVSMESFSYIYSFKYIEQ